MKLCEHNIPLMARCLECEKQEDGEGSPASAGSEPPLIGRWHHGNGMLVCGTIRVATMNFDTDPSPEFRDEVFEWITDTLNKAQNV